MSIPQHFLTGELNGQHNYQFELDNFVREYPDSELIGYASDLILKSDEYKANLYSSSKAQYIREFNEAHNLVLIYPNTEVNGKVASSLFENYLKEHNPDLKFANLLLSDDHSMAVINNIESKNVAETILTSFNEEMTPSSQFEGQRFFTFIMTEQNFGILYQTKDIESYRTFYDKYYQ